MQIDWALLGDCISLRQLSVTRHSDDVRVWLNSNAMHLQELIISDCRGMDGESLAVLIHQLLMPFAVDGPTFGFVKYLWSDADSSDIN